jgi:hypothetical protein
VGSRSSAHPGVSTVSCASSLLKEEESLSGWTPHTHYEHETLQVKPLLMNRKKYKFVIAAIVHIATYDLFLGYDLGSLRHIILC